MGPKIYLKTTIFGFTNYNMANRLYSPPKFLNLSKLQSPKVAAKGLRNGVSYNENDIFGYQTNINMFIKNRGKLTVSKL